MLFEEAENAWIEDGLLAGVASSRIGFPNHDRFPLRVEVLVNEYGSIKLHLDPADLAIPRRSYLDELEGLNALRDHAALAEEAFRANQG